MHSKILGLGLISGLMSAAAFAEPSIQPGDTLESLSKVKIVTTVNGQPGSIQDLVSSGQVQLMEGANPENAAPTEQPLNPTQVQPAQIDSNAPAIAQPQAEQAVAEAENALPTEQQNLAAAPQAVVEPIQAAPENTIMTQEPDSNSAPVIASSAETPVNADEQAVTALPENAQPQQDAFMATPEAPNAAMTDAPMQVNPEAPVADDVIQAAPEAPVTDDAIQAAPEAPIESDVTIN